MNPAIWRSPILDPLHGPITLDDDLLALVRAPVVQRLRHVRLSNIDSIDMPAIANLSRFEHVLGVAHLAGEVGFRGGLSPFELLVLKGSALLHDWAITSFGHLVEEALQYVGTRFDHERRLSDILAGEGPGEIGGADLQILVGRETGIRSWAGKVAGSQGESLMHAMMDHIRGRGRMGRVISGDIDLDNIDNVYRMAFHMGLAVDKAVPVRLARAMVGVTKDGEPIFRTDAEMDIHAWRGTRREVYQHLMLAERDFVGKLMILSATVQAYEAGEITTEDWSLVDHAFIMKLLGSGTREVCETARRWIAGELWENVPLRWFHGKRPEYPELLAFSRRVSGALGRRCFAYGIKDKRERRVTMTFDDGSQRTVGEDTSRWLFGLGSPKREPFGTREVGIVIDMVRSEFGIEPVEERSPREAAQACLF